MNTEPSQWWNTIVLTLQHLGNSVLAVLPTLLGSLLLLALGLALAFLVRHWVARLANAAGLDRLPGRLLSGAQAARYTGALAPSTLLGQFLFWLIVLATLVIWSETLGWSVVSTKVGELLGYLPRLISAVLVFVIGYHVAAFIRRLLETAFGSLEMGGGRMVSNTAFYLIMVFVTISALDQAGVDTTLISTNITIILGSLLLAFAVAFALASRNILGNMLTFLYSQQRFRVGQQVIIGEVQGTVVLFDHMRIVVRTSAADVVIPARQLDEREVRILREP